MTILLCDVLIDTNNFFHSEITAPFLSVMDFYYYFTKMKITVLFTLYSELIGVNECKSYSTHKQKC